MTDLFTLAGVDVPSAAPALLDTPMGALLELQQQKEKAETMIFTEPLFSKVLSGEKTQTRRPVKEGHKLNTHDVYQNGRAVWKWGATYSVQPGRGKPGRGRIRITLIRYLDKARYITMEEAAAEGFNSPEEFRARWTELYGAAALDEPCWALTFELTATYATITPQP